MKFKSQNGLTGLKYLNTNADQLLNKIDHLKMFIVADERGVMMITEVIPKAQKNPILDIQLNIEGYEVYKNFNNIGLDLGSSGLRGVVLYVKSILICKDVIPEIALQHNDQLWIEI